MKSIDALLNRHYDPKNYHCVHFLIESAQYLLGLDYTENFIGLTSSLHETLKYDRKSARKNKVLKPDECDVLHDGLIVVMKNINQSSHVGLFYCDCVLHLTELGVHFLPLSSIRQVYKRIRFYEPNQSIYESA